MKQKKLRIAVCVPTGGFCRTLFCHSLVTLFMNRKVAQVLPEYNHVDMTLLIREATVIHENREELVKAGLEWGCTHILFLDDDMIFSEEVLSLLLSRRKAIVGVNYPKRGVPVTFTATHPENNTKGVVLNERMLTTAESTGLEEANIMGLGVTLIERRVFETVPQPWFLPDYAMERRFYVAEDYMFMERVRDAGFKVWVDQDASKKVAHFGSHAYCWNQWKPVPGEGEIVIGGK